VAAIGMAHHEMWRDEWQAWLLARYSASFQEMLGQVRLEGHMPAWQVLLHLLTRFTGNPVAMQGAHLAIATASIFLLARFSPLPWSYKVLLAFGYFLAYEYAVIARPYAFGVLALFAFCALVPVRRRYPIPTVSALLLLAITSVYGLIVAGAAGGMLMVEAVVQSDRPGRGPFRRRSLYAGIAAWLIGVTVATIAIRPAERVPDVSTDVISLWSVSVTVSSLNRAYVPLPDPHEQRTWNSHFLPRADTRGALALRLVLAVSLVAASALLFIRKPAVLFLYLVGTTGLLLFRQLVHAGHLRHDGHLFLVFVVCLWLAALPFRQWRLPSWVERWANAGARLGTVFVAGMLALHVAAAALLYRADIQRPFSSAPAVAEWLQAEGLVDVPIAASPAPAASSVAGYLDRPLHYLVLGGPGTFIYYGRYQRGEDRNRTAALVRTFLQQHEGEVLLLLRFPLEEEEPDWAVEELARFPPGIEGSEEYVVYRAVPRRPG
jgi:hypothetical protein